MVHCLASRQRSFGIPDTSAGDAALEAPFIFRKDKYYYLFVFIRLLPRAVSTALYKVVIGRSERSRVPYLDKDGVPMQKKVVAVCWFRVIPNGLVPVTTRLYF